MENTFLNTQQDIVPASNAITIAPAVEQYVQRYRHYAKNTVESILKLGETVLEADSKLTRLEVIIFCQEVGIEHNGPTFRKLRKIGQQADRFLPVMDRVPNSWTTVYELAKLETDKFATLVDTGSLTATATMKELREIINDGPKQSADSVTFTLTVKAKNPAQAVEIDRTLGAVGEQLQSAVRVSNKELFERFMAEALEDYDLPEGYLEPEDLEAA